MKVKGLSKPGRLNGSSVVKPIPMLDVHESMGTALGKSQKTIFLIVHNDKRDDH